MARFPSLTGPASPANPIKKRLRFKTLRSSYENDGDPVVKQKSTYVRRDLTFGYRTLSPAEARTVWQFYLDRRGPVEIFNVFEPWPDTYSGEYAGTGDGVQRSWNMPCELAASVTVYIDSVALNAGTDYDYVQQGGVDQADHLLFINNATNETGGNGDGVQTSFNYTLANDDVKPSGLSVHYTIGTTPYTAVDDGGGNINGTNISAGTIDYATGAVAITFTSPPDNGIVVANDYTFYAPPAAGVRITADFTGPLKVRGRFKNNFFDFETFYNTAVNFGVEIEGLLNA